MAGITWWTPQKIFALRRLAAAGQTARRIAETLADDTHRPTPGAVRHIAAANGIRLLARGGRPPKKA